MRGLILSCQRNDFREVLKLVCVNLCRKQSVFHWNKNTDTGKLGHPFPKSSGAPGFRYVLFRCSVAPAVSTCSCCGFAKELLQAVAPEKGIAPVTFQKSARMWY